MEELQKKAERPYKVCFLGYSKLSEVAREVIDSLPDNDVEYVLMDSNLENQDACVEEARQLGCSVFVAGPGNAARFSTHYDDPLVEITIRYIDYAIAIRKALNRGCRNICIARHRFSAPPDLPMLEKLMEVSLQEVTFESIAELREQIRHSDCDAFIGATAANETANALGRTGILVYYGKESIRDACIRAGERARKLHENRQSREITNAILNNSQFGMIVTDTEGRVKLFNRTAQRFTGIAASQIRGKLLMDYFPNLSIAALLKSGQNRSDSYRLVVGAMMRCVQERITQDRRTIGTLITLYPESHNRKKTEQDTPSLARIVCRWEDVIAQSPIMKRTVEQGQNLAKLHYPTMILGQPGSGREIFARCMHSASPQAQKPCITIDLATIAPEDAPHILLGYEGQDGTVSGLLTAANGGSVILKNVALAKPVVHACLMQALTSRHIFRPSMTAPLLLDLYGIHHHDAGGGPDDLGRPAKLPCHLPAGAAVPDGAAGGHCSAVSAEPVQQRRLPPPLRAVGADAGAAGLSPVARAAAGAAGRLHPVRHRHVPAGKGHTQGPVSPAAAGHRRGDHFPGNSGAAPRPDPAARGG